MGPKFDASSKAYADQLVMKIALSWSPEVLTSQGCSEFQRRIEGEQVRTLFARLSSLGKLTRYGGSQGEAHINVTSSGIAVTASYQAMLTFERGNAAFDISLIHDAG